MTTTVNTNSKSVSPWIGILLIVGSNMPMLKFLGLEMSPWINILSLLITGSGIMILFKGMEQQASA